MMKLYLSFIISHSELIVIYRKCIIIMYILPCFCNLQHAEVKSSNAELQRKVETQQEIHTAAIRQMEQERDETKETLSLLEKEYQELADIKVKLDGEISVYRKLLEEEETRFALELYLVQKFPKRNGYQLIKTFIET